MRLVYTLILLCFFDFGWTQERVQTTSKDSVIDGKLLTSKQTIPAEQDTLNIKDLKDHPEAAKLDEKWLEELYSNSLFDTIYKSVTELEYDPVDYPELPTDTLKARLERLNARTPFNVEYNPSLESVIKSYLKYLFSIMVSENITIDPFS